MSITPRTVRLLALGAAACFLVLAFAIRAFSGGYLETDNGLAQHSGTALYASMVYAGALFLWPRMNPLVAGGIALGWCWLVEFAQLTGVPAELSARSVVARLVLGVTFDATDLFWYAVGVVPLVGLHRLALRR